MDCRVKPGNDGAGERSRDAIASAECHTLAMASPQPRHFHFASPNNEGSGAPNGAVDSTCYQASPVENCTRYREQPRSS
jgi:hypothetical protein